MSTVTGAQSSSTVKSWDEYKSLDIDSAKEIVSMAFAANTVHTNSGRVVYRNIDEDYASDEVCYAYRMLGTLTEQFSKTTQDKRTVAAALFIHTTLFAPKERNKSKERMTDGPAKTVRVQASRTVQSVGTSKNLSVPYNESREKFIEDAENLWFSHYSAINAEAQRKQNDATAKAAASLNSAAASLGITVAQLAALAVEMSKKGAE